MKTFFNKIYAEIFKDISGKVLTLIVVSNFILLIWIIQKIIDEEPKKCDEISRNLPYYKDVIIYYPLNNERRCGETKDRIIDYSYNGNNGKINGAVFNASASAYEFFGNQNIRIKNSKSLRSSTFHQSFSVAFFIRFRETSFIGDGSNKDYIHYLGKGNYDDGYEWVFRQYNSSNIEGRSNRLSFYAFNSDGGLGSGAFIQEKIVPGEWMHIVGVVDGKEIRIYKNGVLKNNASMLDYNVVIEPGKADLIIGTTDYKSFLNGSINEFVYYKRALKDEEVANLYNYYRGEN